MLNAKTIGKLFLFSIALILVIGFIVMFLKPTKTLQAQVQTQETPFEIINNSAKAVNSNPTEGNVDKLVRDVVDYLVIEGVPQTDKDELISSLKQAELTFKTQGTGALAEANAVNMNNWLANGFQTPAYAQTDETQIEYLRTLLNRAMPDLVRRKNTPMSPVEAFAVASVMVVQKMDNEEFMVSSSEFNAKIQTPTSYPVRNDNNTSYSVDAVPETAKQLEMRNTLSQNLQTFLSAFGTNGLSPQNTLNALGIPAN